MSALAKDFLKYPKLRGEGGGGGGGGYIPVLYGEDYYFWD